MVSKHGASSDRKILAKCSALVLIAALGIGMASIYGSLEDERDAGRGRLEILRKLQADNDALQKDNDNLRVVLAKQSKLLTDIAKGIKVSDKDIKDATTIPPSTVVVRPSNPTTPAKPSQPSTPSKPSTGSGNGSGTPSGGTPTPKPTVEPTPPVSPEPKPLLCVPLLNVCV